MELDARTSGSVRPKLDQRIVAIVALALTGGMSVVGLLTMAGVIHTVNGAGNPVSTPLNVFLGFVGHVLGALLFVSQVSSLRKGEWPDLSSSTGSATDGDAELGAEIGDHDW